jgi:hypothetical protein
MFRTRLAKALLVPAALMVPASTAALALTTASPAGAAVYNAADAATCTKLTGKVDISTESATGTFSGCTKATTDGTGKFSGSESSSAGKVTWKNKGVTTMSFSFNISGSCGTGTEEIVVTGAVKSSTGKAAKIKKGQKISGGTTANTADFCWNEATNALTLKSGTKFEI